MLKRYSSDKSSLSIAQIIVLIVALIIGLGLRYYFVPVKSSDFIIFLRGWFAYIHEQGGMNAFKSIFSDYNVPYLYLLAIGNYLHLNAIWTVKIWGAIFDVLGAWYIYKIILFIKRDNWHALLGACLYLLLPSIVMLSAVWGQADGIYTSLILGGIYYYLQDKSWLGSGFIALAFAFKLQTIFIFPALAIWILSRKVSWKSMVLIPGIYFLLFIPVALVRGNLKDYATVYLDQSSKNHDLSTSLPNFGAIMQFLGRSMGVHNILQDQQSALKNCLWYMQLGLSFLIALGFIYVGWKKIPQLTPQWIILTATLSTFLFPMILPSMHERYMYTSVALLYICIWIFGSYLIVSFIVTEIVNCLIYNEFISKRKSTTIQRVDSFLHGKPYLGTRAIHFGKDPMLNFRPKYSAWKYIFPHFLEGLCECIALGLLIFYIGSYWYNQNGKHLSKRIDEEKISC